MISYEFLQETEEAERTEKNERVFDEYLDVGFFLYKARLINF